MNCQINAVSYACFNTLSILRKTFKWIPSDSRKTVMHALITSRLDYGNALHARINKQLLRKLQTVQNAAAKLILNIPRHNHITQHLCDIHWLPIKRRITFKLLTHAYKALHNTGPQYLNNRLSFHAPKRNLCSADLSLATNPCFYKNRTGGKSFSYLTAKT